MQRCIDAASEQQKVQLVAGITLNALALVQACVSCGCVWVLLL